MRKTRSKKGFTLAELLVVMAVIAILVAIAIPVFGSQLDKARQQVDEANLRTASELAVNDFLSGEPSSSGKTYYFNQDKNKQLTIGSSGDATNIKPQSSKNKGTIKVTIDANGEITSADWTGHKS